MQIPWEVNIFDSQFRRKEDCMKEFRKIKSLKFLYEVNEDGVIRNVKSKKIIQGYKEKNGYIRVRFENKCLGGVVRTTVHRLVAEAFLPNPDNLEEVNHIDSNRANNHVSNLEWVTHSDNMKHAYANNRMPQLEQNHILSRKQITNGLRIFESISIAAEWLADEHKAKNKESAIAGISAVCRGKRKTFGGFYWEYV